MTAAPRFDPTGRVALVTCASSGLEAQVIAADTEGGVKQVPKFPRRGPEGDDRTWPYSGSTRTRARAVTGTSATVDDRQPL